MAVTKIHPIKSTLKKALDYIENPDKTDEKLFVSSYGCSYETADIEFQMLLDQAYQKGNNLAHHLIQAFEPGETTAEQAHEIGRQLADEVLQGKYPYVITTHIDKGHLHNHIIFCAVDMANQRKYMSYPQYRKARRLTHECCNYCNGNCLLLDDGEECVCVQSISYSLLCRWFRVAVLPLDAALCAEITKGRDEIKRCAVCGAAFTPNSNRAKYCPDCAVQVRRKKEAERQRKRYLLSTHLGR